MIRLHAETAGAGAAGGSGLRSGFKSLQPVETFLGTWLAYPWFALPVENLMLHEVAANAKTLPMVALTIYFSALFPRWPGVRNREP
jgi:hypothetical protein